MSGEQARALAKRWSEARSVEAMAKAARADLGLAMRLSLTGAELSCQPLTDPEREQLFAWVRARMAREVDAMMSVWAECGGPAATEDEWRESLADAVGHGLGLSKGDGTKATATAWDLCEQSGWPS